MGLLSILTGGISKKYEAVQELANSLSIEEAVYCYSLSLGHLCMYLDDPLDPSNSQISKTAYVEVIVALYERLRGSDPWFGMSKGSFRMALTKAVLQNSAGQGSFAIRSQLGKFDYQGNDREWSNADQDRLGWHVIDMQETGP